MLEYHHSSKAGNHGDVLKHVVWKLLLTEKQKENNDNGILIVDTHAGNGRYVISSSEKGEAYCKGARSGIVKVLEQKDHPDNTCNKPQTVVENYLQVIRELNAKHRNDEEDDERIPSQSRITLYPGSPLITQMACRSCDDHFLFEINDSHYQELKEILKDFDHSKIYPQNGLQAAPAVVRKNAITIGKGCLCLIDPPYEVDDECQEVVTAVDQILRTNSTVSLMIWIPSFVTKHPRKEQFWDLQSNLKSLTESMSINTILLSLYVSDKGMNGSHVFIINPTSDLHSILEFSRTLPWLAKALAQQKGCSSYNIDYQKRK